MANVYGFSTFGSNSGNNVLPNGNKNIYSLNDLYITTISDKKISINCNKTNVNADDGDVLFNDNTTGADVVVKNGDLTIENGDLLANDVYAYEDFVGRGNINTPCVITSLDNFDPGGTTEYFSSIMNVASPANDRLQRFIYPVYYTNQNFRTNNLLTGTDPTWTVQIQVPANTPGEVLVYIPANININLTYAAPFQTVNMNFKVAPIFTYANTSSPGGGTESTPTYYNGTWYNLDPTAGTMSVTVETSPGSGSYVHYNSTLFWQNTNVSNPAGECSVSVSQQSSQVFYLDDSVTFVKDLGVFVYRFYANSVPVATNYRLWFGYESLITFSQSWGTDQVYHAMHLNPTSAPIRYTVTDQSVTIPTNTAVGTSMINNLCFRNAIPLFTTGWLSVSKNSQYQIIHNLTMTTARPFRMQILFSTTNDGSYPVSDITSQGYGQGNANLCGAYLCTQSDANSILLASGAYSVGVTVVAGSGTSMYINNESGYWNVFIY